MTFDERVSEVPRYRETLVSLSLRLKDLQGPVTRVKKKKKKYRETENSAFVQAVRAIRRLTQCR